MEELTAEAKEKSTFIVTASFKDEDGNPVIPNSGLKWHLTDLAGTTINSRADVVVSSIAQEVHIALSGNDLALTDGKDSARVFTIEGTYNSALGSSLPFKESAMFMVRNLIKI